jgi:hypothetical protein
MRFQVTIHHYFVAPALKCSRTLVICLVVSVLLNFGIARGDAPESSFGYPGSFEVLKHFMDAVKRADSAVIEAALTDPSTNADHSRSGISQWKRNIESARRALFYLEYYYNTLSRDDLNQVEGDFVLPWVNVKSVPKLIDEARKCFLKLKIPLPRPNEFGRPKRPEKRQCRPVAVKNCVPVWCVSHDWQRE